MHVVSTYMTTSDLQLVERTPEGFSEKHSRVPQSGALGYLVTLSHLQVA